MDGESSINLHKTACRVSTGRQPSSPRTADRFGEGYLNGFRGVYFTLDKIRVGVYSTQDDRLRFHDIPVTPGMVRLHPVGSTVPVLLTQPVYGTDGRLRILGLANLGITMAGCLVAGVLGLAAGRLLAG